MVIQIRHKLEIYKLFIFTKIKNDIGETETGCQILWFLIFEEAVFTVSLSIISVSRNIGHIFPTNLRS